MQELAVNLKGIDALQNLGMYLFVLSTHDAATRCISGKRITSTLCPIPKYNKQSLGFPRGY